MTFNNCLHFTDIDKKSVMMPFFKSIKRDYPTNRDLNFICFSIANYLVHCAISSVPSYLDEKGDGGHLR